MSRKDNIFTTTLRLNLKNPQDQEAWDNLMYADDSQPEYSSYTRTIVTAINDHFRRMNQPEEKVSEAALLKKVEETVKRVMTEYLQGAVITAAPKEAVQPTSDPIKPDEPSDENMQ